MSCSRTWQVADDEIYLVVNAGCREKDLAHLNKHLEKFQVRHTTPSKKRSLPGYTALHVLQEWSLFSIFLSVASCGEQRREALETQREHM